MKVQPINLFIIGLLAYLPQSNRFFVIRSTALYSLWTLTFEKTYYPHPDYVDDYAEMMVPNWSSGWHWVFIVLMVLNILDWPRVSRTGMAQHISRRPLGATLAGFIGIDHPHPSVHRPPTPPQVVNNTMHATVYETAPEPSPAPAPPTPSGPTQSGLIVVRENRAVRRGGETASGVPMRDRRTVDPDTL
jgi:hypothetical protein